MESYSSFMCQLGGENICPFSWCKHHRGADGLGGPPRILRQNSCFTLLYRFVGILRLFKDSDPVVEYDDGKHRNLFDFSEPKDAAPNQRCPTLVLGGVLASVQCIPLHQQRKV